MDENEKSHWHYAHRGFFDFEIFLST